MSTVLDPPTNVRRTLASVATLTKQYGGCFTESQLRAWVHNRDKNGLAACVVKPNLRRLYIDVDLFEVWLAKRTRELSPSVDST
jgi:hypothetical protein